MAPSLPMAPPSAPRLDCHRRFFLPELIAGRIPVADGHRLRSGASAGLQEVQILVRPILDQDSAPHVVLHLENRSGANLAIGQNPNRTPSEHPNPHQHRLKWLVHLPQNGTISFDPQPYQPSRTVLNHGTTIHLLARCAEACKKVRSKHSGQLTEAIIVMSMS